MKGAEAVMKLLDGYVAKTTHVMDRLVQDELIVEYLLWSTINAG